MPWIATHELTPETLSAHQHQIYNALDVCVTLECFQEINRLQGNAPLPVVYDFARAMQAPALDMMLRGFKIDRMACEAGKADLRAKLARIETILNRYANAVWDKSLNPRSTKQLLDFFYSAMKLPEVTIYKKGVPKRSMDREVLEKLQAHFYAQPIIEAILAYRDNAKRLEVLETEIDPDGRMRTSYNIVGTETGRWSSSTSALGSGSNMQNLSPDLRSIFVADPGFKICGIDLEQAESREVGWRCGILFDDWSYLDACESGDLHTAVCQIAWPELPWTGDLRKDKALAEEKFYRHLSRRDLAKKLGHGCLTADHEVLTPSGWVPITSKPEYILQWSEDHSEFAPVSNWIDKEWTGDLHTWEGQSLSVCMTADHRVYYTTDQTIRTGAAERIPESAKIPLGEGQFASMRSVTRKVEHATARVLCPTVPSGAFYIRRNGLISVTGNSNYYGQPSTMAKHAKIETKIAKQFQDIYFGRFVGIPKWHHWVAEQLQTTQRIVTPFGRERYFFGRPRDDATLREAIAYDPQSSTGDRLNLGLYRIWRDLSPRVQLLAQVHDAVYFQYREDDDEAEIVTKALALLSTKLTAPNGRVFDVPGEAKVGFNWGNFHPTKNPDGLAKFKGIDSRKRTPLLERVL